MREIRLPADLPGPWPVVAELAELLPTEWVLIGGLMVQIHALERGIEDVRATIDVDVLGQARPQGALRAIDTALVKAVGVPGGSQALRRSEAVRVRIGDAQVVLRRPTLSGAVLIKARSLLVHTDPESQREDLLRLLCLIDDPRAMASEIRDSERRWLRRAEPRLRFDTPSSLSAQEMRRARQALALLLR